MKTKFKIIFIILLCFGILICGTLGSLAVVENNIMQAATPVVGEYPEYNFSTSDAFDINSQRSIATNDGSVKILQLTDTHFRNRGTFGSKVGMNYIYDGYCKAQIRRLVQEARPDLIVITGDLITFLNAGHAYREIVEFMDTLNVKWTVTFGNHDGEYNCDKAALLSILREGKNCIMEYGATNFTYTLQASDTKEQALIGEEVTTGLGNFCILVKDKNGTVRNAVVLMDSNDYYYSATTKRKFATTSGGFYPKQIEWYNWLINGITEYTGRVVPSSLFSHIPFDKETDRFGFSDVLKQNGSTQFLFSGHTHAAGAIVDYRGLTQTNGVKTGINYKEDPNTGGTIIEFDSDGNAKISLANSTSTSVTITQTKTINFIR